MLDEVDHGRRGIRDHLPVISIGLHKIVSDRADIDGVKIRPDNRGFLDAEPSRRIAYQALHDVLRGRGGKIETSP
ncbi:hypothetical protein [Paractinoplanes lichenicola]|uniref:Uncharacterized protein n=1 Tax=Paractinoplanes lichenicola TaxID=2802976 RepID=A0ABS1VQG1_9ACTN|nr:hypothetical protein [Actinoplanes lichenicola]MBL7256002.1 hypothetical protein [Actinoplanes lichenicola]